MSQLVVEWILELCNVSFECGEIPEVRGTVVNVTFYQGKGESNK